MDLEKARKFIQLVAVAHAIFDDPTLSGKEKFDRIFSKEVTGKIRGLGISIRYFDPDSSYEEDCEAFLNAADAKVAEVQAQMLAETQGAAQVTIGTATCQMLIQYGYVLQYAAPLWYLYCDRENYYAHNAFFSGSLAALEEYAETLYN